MFRYLTAGESHGPALFGILDGLPAHLKLDVERINQTLAQGKGADWAFAAVSRRG